MTRSLHYCEARLRRVKADFQSISQLIYCRRRARIASERTSTQRNRLSPMSLPISVGQSSLLGVCGNSTTGLCMQCTLRWSDARPIFALPVCALVCDVESTSMLERVSAVETGQLMSGVLVIESEPVEVLTRHTAIDTSIASVRCCKADNWQMTEETEAQCVRRSE